MSLRGLFPRGLRRAFHRLSLGDQDWRFLFDPGPPDECVVFDCETTGLNVAKDDIVAIAAVKIRGDRIVASERFEAFVRPEAAISPDAIRTHRLREADVEAAAPMREVLPDFLRFVAGRPLVGYYLEFDVAMVDKYLLPFLGIELPNPRIEISKLYYDRKYGDAPPGARIDLSFARILEDLGLPAHGLHDAFNDAMLTAMIYLALRDMRARGVRIPRARGAQEQTGFGA